MGDVKELEFTVLSRFYYDKDAPKRGGHPFAPLLKWRFWAYYRQYFPIELVKTAELSPKHNYVFG